MSSVYSALWPIQQAFATVLLADSTLVGLLAKDSSDPTKTRPAIFGGDVSENQPTPFLILGDNNREQPIDTFDSTTFNDEFIIHCWDDAHHSPDVLYQILSSLNRLLHKKSLPLNGGLTTLHCFLAPGGTLGPITEPDGISKHLIVPYHLFAS